MKSLAICYTGSKRGAFAVLLASLSIGAITLSAQPLAPVKASEDRATLENPEAGWGAEYKNWVEFSAGGFFVDENKKESPYWMDVGTLDTYFQANMDLVAVQPYFNLYDRDWPVRTHQLQFPPAKFVFADEGLRMGVAIDSIVSAGCILSGGRAVSSVLSPGVRINSYSLVERSILFPHVVIGRHCLIRNAIIDRGVQIPEHSVIGFDPQSDRNRYAVTENGIVVVSPERDTREE